MTVDIALFPIPELVAFPGTEVPLHVFEPRYRQMVHECVQDDRPIGVCHTRKKIHDSKAGQSVEEALSSNQATYKPYEVFSAGPCQIVEIEADGRIHANITIEERYEIESEVQTLPYRIVTARVLADSPEVPEAELVEQMRTVNNRLHHMLSARNPELGRLLQHEAWLSQAPGEYSFRLFQMLRFDADIMQSILESTCPGDRLSRIEAVLDEVG